MDAVVAEARTLLSASVSSYASSSSSSSSAALSALSACCPVECSTKPKTFPPFIRQYGFTTYYIDGIPRYQFGCTTKRILCVFPYGSNESLIVVQLTPDNWKPGCVMILCNQRNRALNYLAIEPRRNDLDGGWVQGQYKMKIMVNNECVLATTLYDELLNLDDWGYGMNTGPQKWWDAELGC